MYLNATALLTNHSIGNAREAGMAKALKLSSSDYSLAVSIFFIGYLLLEVPSNMILSRTRPSIYLPSLMVSGSVLLLTPCKRTDKAQIVWGGMV